MEKGGEWLGVPEKEKLYMRTAKQTKDMLLTNVYWQQKGVLETKGGLLRSGLPSEHPHLVYK